MSGSDPVALQAVTIDSSCGGSGITLLDEYGALEFVTYENCDGLHQCFVDVDYKYAVTNVGTVDLTITELERVFNGETTDLTAGVSSDELMLNPLEQFCSNEVVEISCCTPQQFSVQSSVVAEGANAVNCEDNDSYNFDKVIGTPFPSPSPSSSPSVEPSASPSEEPSSTPSAEPSASPSAEPSSSPSSLPTSVPSSAPSSLPSAVPSAMPSPVNSLAPSTSPSDIPTQIPSVGPSLIPPSDLCFVTVEVLCDTNSGIPCDAIPILPTRCESRPRSMVFRYNGGACTQSFNIQPPTLFSCLDFQGGPPTQEGQESYIIAQDIRGLGVIYFEGFVKVGESFLVEDGGNQVQPNMNITIWNSAVTTPENMVQTMVYHSSCSQNLFLKDRYGSVQLVIFVNDVQGEVTCFLNATYSFNIANEGDFSFQLLSLFSVTNLGAFNLTDAVLGQEILPGQGFVVERNILIDLTVRQRYTAATTITGSSPQGNICRDTNFLNFIAGNPLPPIFPTFAPTLAPTVTASPSADPMTTACSISANIRCDVVSGQQTTCFGLAAPSPEARTCLDNLANPIDDNPNRLQFLYSGAGCPGSNSGVGFECTDFNGGPAGLIQAWVAFESGSFQELFQDRVVVGEIFNVQSRAPFNFLDATTVTVSDVLPDGSGPGELRQQMTIPTSCRAADDLTLLKSFGALILSGFTNDATGTQNAFATVQVTYEVENLGLLSADITRATSSSDLDGTMERIDTPITVLRRERVTLGAVETQTVNLIAQSMSTFSFDLSLSGATTAGQVGCEADRSLSFTVG
mmetsp:Transcript_24780/g.35330  ORF Transcript_24780/g.35330 Transcript_24780/m.35330 type:complete len:798 (+) Transcript_24780:1-2394(+)